MIKTEIDVGDYLYHHTDKPVEQFSAEAGNVVYFGRTKNSVDLVGGVGYLLLFQVISNLGLSGLYGSRDGWGMNGDWISMPAEVAAENLQHVETIMEYSSE